MTALSTAFSEICNAIQVGNEEGLAVSSAAILTIADLIQDSQGVYRKIPQAVGDQPGIATLVHASVGVLSGISSANICVASTMDVPSLSLTLTTWIALSAAAWCWWSWDSKANGCC